MRELDECGDLTVLSPGVFSVLHLRAIEEPLFSNLERLRLRWIAGGFIPFIPLFLSPRTAVVHITFTESDCPSAVVASMISTFPTLCPNLQGITLTFLPRNPIIAAAVSGMILANRNTLRYIDVDSLLTEEAREVIFKLPGLRELSILTERGDSLPSVELPNLTNLTIEHGHDSNWLRMFRGATFGKLEVITFHSWPNPTDDFLDAFESALTASTSATLSALRFYTPRSWRPNYRSLLPFTRLKRLTVEFSCDDGCSSTIDDDIITDIARAMPGLETLQLGGTPCRIPTGVTARGLTALAHHCLRLSTLTIHIQVAGLDLPAVPVVPPGETAIPRGDCALTDICVGKIPLPEEYALAVAITLLRIFPHIDDIRYLDGGWRKVVDAVKLFKRLIDHSSKIPSLAQPRSKVYDTSTRSRI